MHSYPSLDRGLLPSGWAGVYVDAADTRYQLSKYQFANNFEKQTSVPKVYVFLGLVGVYFFLIFFNIGGQFLVNTAGFLLPAYYSLDALFSAGKVDDTQVSSAWVLSISA